MTNATRAGHAIHIAVGIEASPDAVWKALTEPAELARWFPLEASVKPGSNLEPSNLIYGLLNSSGRCTTEITHVCPSFFFSATAIIFPSSDQAGSVKSPLSSLRGLRPSA